MNYALKIVEEAILEVTDMVNLSRQNENTDDDYELSKTLLELKASKLVMEYFISSKPTLIRDLLERVKNYKD